ncbi:MAG: TIGR04283 family arsenosugar biosynthesis glycosyltransferase [Pseudomonadales bacterium]
MRTPFISIVIPVVNEAAHIESTLVELSSNSGNDPEFETIVVDGGSDDDTLAIAKRKADKVIDSPRGRAAQMNAGAETASGDILLFLHADTRLPDNFSELLASEFWSTDHAWGRFDTRLDSTRPILRLVGCMMNVRSRLTGICTGDQAIFVRRSVFEQLGGFAQIPLMEDIEISKRLKTISSPFCVSSPVITSSRRWEQYGVAKTIMLMWWLRLRYFLGDTPESLVKQYR